MQRTLKAKGSNGIFLNKSTDLDGTKSWIGPLAQITAISSARRTEEDEEIMDTDSVYVAA